MRKRYPYKESHLNLKKNSLLTFTPWRATTTRSILPSCKVIAEMKIQQTNQISIKIWWFCRRMFKAKLLLYGLLILFHRASLYHNIYALELPVWKAIIFNEILVVVVFALALYARHHVFTSAIPRYTHLILSTKKKIILKKV